MAEAQNIENNSNPLSATNVDDCQTANPECVNKKVSFNEDVIVVYASNVVYKPNALIDNSDEQEDFKPTDPMTSIDKVSVTDMDDIQTAQIRSNNKKVSFNEDVIMIYDSNVVCKPNALIDDSDEYSDDEQEDFKPTDPGHSMDKNSSNDDIISIDSTNVTDMDDNQTVKPISIIEKVSFKEDVIIDNMNLVCKPNALIDDSDEYSDDEQEDFKPTDPGPSMVKNSSNDDIISIDSTNVTDMDDSQTAKPISIIEKVSFKEDVIIIDNINVVCKPNPLIDNSDEISEDAQENFKPTDPGPSMDKNSSNDDIISIDSTNVTDMDDNQTAKPISIIEKVSFKEDVIIDNMNLVCKPNALFDNSDEISEDAQENFEPTDPILSMDKVSSIEDSDKKNCKPTDPIPSMDKVSSNEDIVSMNNTNVANNNISLIATDLVDCQTANPKSMIKKVSFNENVIILNYTNVLCKSIPLSITDLDEEEYEPADPTPSMDKVSSNEDSISINNTNDNNNLNSMSIANSDKGDNKPADPIPSMNKVSPNEDIISIGNANVANKSNASIDNSVSEDAQKDVSVEIPTMPVSNPILPETNQNKLKFDNKMCDPGWIVIVIIWLCIIVPVIYFTLK